MNDRLFRRRNICSPALVCLFVSWSESQRHIPYVRANELSGYLIQKHTHHPKGKSKELIIIKEIYRANFPLSHSILYIWIWNFIWKIYSDVSLSLCVQHSRLSIIILIMSTLRYLKSSVMFMIPQRIVQECSLPPILSSFASEIRRVFCFNIPQFDIAICA